MQGHTKFPSFGPHNNYGNKPESNKRGDKRTFPSQYSDCDHRLGINIREYFAVMAMQGLLTTNAANTSGEAIASAAVEMADLLLKELEKKGEQV